MILLPLMLTIFTLAGAKPVPVNCTPTPPAIEPTGQIAWGITQYAQGQARYISVYGGIGCLALVYLQATDAERAAMVTLNPTYNWPYIIGDGLLLDLHEAVHVALNQQGRSAGLSASAEECLDGQTTDPLIGRLVSKLVPSAMWQDVDVQIAAYESYLLDWSQCSSGPAPTTP